MTTQSTKNYPFAAIIILAHAVFFLLALHWKHIFNGDSFEYIYEAFNIKEKGFFYSGNPALPITEEYMTFRLPLYPLFLMVIYTFCINNWVVLLVQNIISIFTIFFFRNTLFHIGYQKKADWLLLVLLLLYPAQFIHANTIEPEILLQSTVVLYFHFFVRWVTDRNIKWTLLMSVALIAGLMVKPVLYPFSYFHLGLMIFFAIKWKSPIVNVFCYSALPVIIVLLYSGWNLERTGKFHVTSNQSFNSIYYFYFYKSDQNGVKSAQKFLKKERATTASFPAFKDRYNYAQDRGKELLKENFTGYMLYHIKHSFRFFIDPGKGDIDLFTGRLSYGALYVEQQNGFYAEVKTNGFLKGATQYFRQSPGVLIALIILVFNLLKMAGMLLFLRLKAVSFYIRMIVFILIGYFAFLTGPLATPRYVIPVSLLLVGAGTIGLYKTCPLQKKPDT